MVISQKSASVWVTSPMRHSNLIQPLHTIIRQYMQMIMSILMFIRTVRTRDWKLHLRALESFTPLFFALNKLPYARMIPLYLADVAGL